MISPRTASRCHASVAAALKDGVLVRGECEVCGSLLTQAHHDDYERPLDVRWLCPRHHQAWHRDHPSNVDWGKQPVISLRVSDEELNWLRQYGKREERSVSWVLRRAVRSLMAEGQGARS